MLDVIALFKDQDSRDEMGIGSIRDAIADILFPGTGTVQTRARYFLIIPWMYRELERKGVSSADVAAKARQQELKLIDVLLASDDNAGTIGRVARSRLKRLPSSIYWQGLGRWGILNFQGSQDAYHRSLDAYHRAYKPAGRTDEGELIDDLPRGNWRDGLPDAPSDFPRTADLRLTREEAEYLSERIRASAPKSMLTAILSVGRVPRDESGQPVWSRFPWDQGYVDKLPDQLEEVVAHARCFSVTILGTALLYNLMLAEKQGNSERVDHYNSELAAWSVEVVEVAGAIRDWDLNRFWSIVTRDGARVPAPARAFVESWLKIAVYDGASARVSDSPAARSLVGNRERSLKGAQSRLVNPQALNQWSGAAGTGQLTFRWGNAQQILIDIMSALEQGVRHA